MLLQATFKLIFGSTTVKKKHLDKRDLEILALAFSMIGFVDS
jgi:hypothetical protein